MYLRPLHGIIPCSDLRYYDRKCNQNTYSYFPLYYVTHVTHRMHRMVPPSAASEASCNIYKVNSFKLHCQVLQSKSLTEFKANISWYREEEIVAGTTNGDIDFCPTCSMPPPSNDFWNLKSELTLSI